MKTVLILVCICAALSVSAASHIQFVPFDSIAVTDCFWQARLETNRTVTVPHNLDKCEEVGIVENFRRAAKVSDGDYLGLPNWDEFLYKAIEAASYTLMSTFDAELDWRLDGLIAIIAAAQEPDGYLRTFYQLTNTPHWTNLQGGLEFYCAGHLYEAAVAHYVATGKRTLLDVALKNVALVLTTFGPGKNIGVPGHEEIELALVRLYEVTGDKRYVELAKFFIDQRGNKERSLYGAFFQDHLPFLQQSVAVGQAPRATYLYSGAADVSYHLNTTEYWPTLARLWSDVVGTKMYITGGIGARNASEDFGEAYELPNITACTEVCAAISFSMWNSRMFKLTGDAHYFDVLERTLYNNFLAGVSLSGDRYFYACPPASDGVFTFNIGWNPAEFDAPYHDASATRKEWFPCACCPPNLARYMATIPGLMYAVDDRTIFINLFIGSTTTIPLRDNNVSIIQKTDYPWSGQISLEIDPQTADRFAVFIRIPGWARNEAVPGDLYVFQENYSELPCVTVNSKTLPLVVENGFIKIEKFWQRGDVIHMDLPMPIRKIECSPRVPENQNKIAVQRGPIVYCAEGFDNDGRVLQEYLPPNAIFSSEFVPDFLGGVQMLNTTSQKKAWRLIPYYAWSNRGVGEMSVLLLEGE